MTGGCWWSRDIAAKFKSINQSSFLFENEKRWIDLIWICGASRPREQSSNCFSFVKKRNAAVPAEGCEWWKQLFFFPFFWWVMAAARGRGSAQRKRTKEKTIDWFMNNKSNSKVAQVGWGKNEIEQIDEINEVKLNSPAAQPTKRNTKQLRLRGKPIQQLFFLWARCAPSKKKIIAEMDGAALLCLVELVMGCRPSTAAPFRFIEFHSTPLQQPCSFFIQHKKTKAAH